MHRSSTVLAAILPATLTLLAACAGSPAYREPAVALPSTFGLSAASTTERVIGDSIVTQGTAAASPRTAAASPLRAAPVHYNTGRSPAPFWRDIGDTTLTLLIEEAVRANTDVRVAEARLIGARAARRLSALDLAPTITALGSTTRQRLSMAQVPGLTQQLPEQQLWDVGVDASWELDIFGRVGRTVGAQSAFVASSEYALEDVQVSVAAEVARTYFEMRGAQQQLAVAQRNAANQRGTVALTEDRLAGGRGTAFDTERAKSVLYLTLAAVPGIESQIALQRYRIGVLLGRVPDALPAALFATGGLPRLPDTLYVGSPEQLVRRRPDVLRAERVLAAQSLLVGVARAEYLPRLTIGAHVGSVATSFDSLSRAGTSRIAIGPVLSWPLFDLGRVRERVDLAHAREDAAQAEHTAAVLRAVEETDAALMTYDRAHARLGILNDAVRSSTHAAALAEQRFEAGLTDFLQVLDAQRTQLEAENQLAQGHTAAATALVAVYKATGGSWPLR
jgi:multidrug efflux system outer membrane protein